MTDKDDVGEIQTTADFEDVDGVTVEVSVFPRIVRRSVGLSRTDVVEKNHAVRILESGRDKPPHVLIAAESVCKQHRRTTLARDLHVVSPNHIWAIGRIRHCLILKSFLDSASVPCGWAEVQPGL